MRTRIQDQTNNNFQILRELSMREKTQNITNNTRKIQNKFRESNRKERRNGGAHFFLSAAAATAINTALLLPALI